jgi:hypothetical protein
MTQEDITLLTPYEWVPISCPDGILHILVIRNGDIRLRFGSSSTSEGMLMYPGDTISVNETVYVKVKNQYLATIPVLISVAR